MYVIYMPYTCYVLVYIYMDDVTSNGLFVGMDVCIDVTVV